MLWKVKGAWKKGFILLENGNSFRFLSTVALYFSKVGDLSSAQLLQV